MSHDIAKKIGKNVAAARHAQKRIQAEVAEAVGIDIMSLSRIERGVTTPGIPTLDKIANVLGIPLTRLLDGTSANSSALADHIIAQLEPLKEADRLFLMEQMQVWAKKLAAKK